MPKQKDISFLALAFLALLFYPELIKSVHAHEPVHQCCSYSDSVVFGQQDENCAVCDFEFLNFISDPAGQQTFRLPELSIANHTGAETPFLSHPFYYSLRAPPTA